MLLAIESGYSTRADAVHNQKTLFSEKREELSIALMDAVSDSGSCYVNNLIKNGADVNYADKDGDTPLFKAAFGGHPHQVKKLLECGADVNHTNKNGCTALMCAIGDNVYGVSSIKPWTQSYGSTDILEHLLNYGADVNKFDKNGNTALVYAARYSKKYNPFAKPKTSYDELYRVVYALLKHDADINHVNNDGDTAITIAERDGNARTVRLLRETLYRGKGFLDAENTAAQ